MAAPLSMSGMEELCSDKLSWIGSYSVHRRNWLPFMPPLTDHEVVSENRLSGCALRRGADSIELTYALDFAEIPTFELLQEYGRRKRDAVIARAAQQAPVWLSMLRISGDQRLTAHLQHATAVMQDGAGGLPVLPSYNDGAHASLTRDRI